jgi:hypothetical protein
VGHSKKDSRGLRGEIAKLCRGKRHADTKILVMPGLDPGIHQPSPERFSKQMDCRVKPGNDEVN